MYLSLIFISRLNAFSSLSSGMAITTSSISSHIFDSSILKELLIASVSLRMASFNFLFCVDTLSVWAFSLLVFSIMGKNKSEVIVVLQCFARISAHLLHF